MVLTVKVKSLAVFFDQQSGFYSEGQLLKLNINHKHCRENLRLSHWEILMVNYLATCFNQHTVIY